MAHRGENIFKRKDGRWEARYILRYEGGKAIYRYLYGKTYAEAKSKRLQEEISNASNTAPSGSGILFTQLSSEWLTRKKGNVKESTYTRYVRAIQVYLLPAIGSTRLKYINLHQINELTTMFLRQGGANGNPLSAKTVGDILCVLKSILSYGKAQGYCSFNLEGIKYPNISTKPTSILSETARRKIEELLLNSEDALHLGILFALFTGVRIGELCGLQWGDFDFDNQTVSINRTVSRIADLDPLTQQKTKIVITEPKTACARRMIPLPLFLVDKLSQHKQEYNTYFLTGDQKPSEPQRYYVQYRKFLASHKLEHQSFHSLRHSFATQCMELGFDVKSLSEILGHSNVKTTLSLYVHPSMKQKQEQMNRLIPSCLF